MFRKESCYTCAGRRYALVVKSESERGPIGSWLVRERERLNLSAAEVARKASIPEASYRAIEAGRWTPRGDRLAALQAAVGSSAPNAEEAAPPDWAERLEIQLEMALWALGVTPEQQAELLVQRAAGEAWPPRSGGAAAPGGGGRSASARS